LQKTSLISLGEIYFFISVQRSLALIVIFAKPNQSNANNPKTGNPNSKSTRINKHNVVEKDANNIDAAHCHTQLVIFLEHIFKKMGSTEIVVSSVCPSVRLSVCLSPISQPL
jgi:hypothetical protein